MEVFLIVNLGWIHARNPASAKESGGWQPKVCGDKDQKLGSRGGCTSKSIKAKLGEVLGPNAGDRYGVCTGPNCGVFTGVANPTISVRVLV